MRRVLVDLNLVLDVLLDRAPYVEGSAALWASIESGEAEGLLSAHCVTTLHYLASRSGGRAFGDRCVSDVLAVFGVAAVDRSVLEEALELGWVDFEDAVSAAAAVAAGCHLIATRDPAGFRKSAIPALDPKAALLAVRASRPVG